MPITSATVRERDNDVRINNDLMAATVPVALAKDDWVVLWKDPDAVRFPGMNAEEMKLPFDIGMCKGDYAADYPGDSSIRVHLFRQLKGDPNLTFTPLLDESRKPWIVEVERQCVISVNPKFRSNAYALTTKGKKQILETRHHSLDAWEYLRGGQGMVLRLEAPSPPSAPSPPFPPPPAPSAPPPSARRRRAHRRPAPPSRYPLPKKRIPPWRSFRLYQYEGPCRRWSESRH